MGFFKVHLSLFCGHKITPNLLESVSVYQMIIITPKLVQEAISWSQILSGYVHNYCMEVILFLFVHGSHVLSHCVGDDLESE